MKPPLGRGIRQIASEVNQEFLPECRAPTPS
jgi:hypothetical protein